MDTSEFTDEQIEALQALADGYNDQSVSRRDVMKLVGAGGVGALLGGGGAASAVGQASAGTAQSGQLGAVGDPLDLVTEDLMDESGNVVASANAGALEGADLRYGSVNTDELITKTTPHVDVREFGAVGDGVTDDTAAIRDAISHTKSISQDRILYFPSDHEFLVTDSLFFGVASPNDYGVKACRVDGKIVGQTGGKPLIDWTGELKKALYGNGVIEGASTNSPNIGILLARNDTDASAGRTHVQGVVIGGYYTLATVYNYASEQNVWRDVYLTNQTGDRVVYITEENAANVTSPNTTLATGQQSNNGHYFDGCVVDYKGAGGAGASEIETGSVKDLSIERCFLNSGPDDHPAIIISQETAQVYNISISKNLFHGTHQHGVDFLPGNYNQFSFTENRLGTITGYSVHGKDAKIDAAFMRVGGNVQLDGLSDLNNAWMYVTGGDVFIGRDFNGAAFVTSGGTHTFADTGVNDGLIYYYDTGEVQRGTNTPVSGGPVGDTGDLEHIKTVSFSDTKETETATTYNTRATRGVRVTADLGNLDITNYSKLYMGFTTVVKNDTAGETTFVRVGDVGGNVSTETSATGTSWTPLSAPRVDISSLGGITGFVFGVKVSAGTASVGKIELSFWGEIA